MKIKNPLTGLIVLLGLVSACQSTETNNMIEREIKSGWKYSQVNGKLEGVATVPGTIHTDLLANKEIEDPFYRTNEKKQQWIDKEDWEYSTTIHLSDREVAKENLMLHFNGLDTYADVYFNDSLVLEAENMFCNWEVDIKSLASVGENKLMVYLHSPIKKGLELLEASDYAYPATNDQSENGEMGDKKVSIFTRKAGYHYGWDWGPRFVTSGIWRPVVLKAWDTARIKDLFIKQPRVTAEKAELEAVVSLDVNHVVSGAVVLKDAQTDKVIAEKKIELTERENNEVNIPFTIANPKLWWSNGLGGQPLYEFKTELFVGNKLVAEKSVKTGIRSIKLVREKDEKGESFCFELNGVPVFAKGANYIPNDNFLPRVSEVDYQKVVNDAADANMNMLRVWGGGIYENDYFYELCDEKGILVWQDFMFACSMYPGDEDFLKSIKQEAIDNVVRLRNHPSIALWCGNNEMNTAWNYYSEGGWGWKELYTKEQQEEINNSYLKIFHELLPEVIEKYTDRKDYWPSSPMAGYEPDMHTGYETTSGDIHYWGVWHGLHPFKDFNKYVGRFISEYGFQSFPEFETVKKYALPEDFDIESEVMSAHQRSGIGNLRIREYMGWYYRVPKDFQKFLYMSHVLQARGIKMAIEAHRRAMPYCMGSLYWQINDCWPVASWSSTDYHHNWKALHYAARKAYEPVMISLWEEKDKFELYVVSDKLNEINGQLIIKTLDFNGNVVAENSFDATIAANTSSLIKTFSKEALLGKADAKEVVLTAEIIVNGKLVADNCFYLEKPKNLALPEAKIDYLVEEVNGKKILKVKSDKVACQVYFTIPDTEAFFSDNYFDVIPGKEYQVEVQTDLPFGKIKKSIKVMHLQEAMWN